jgi:hypothetical protein
VEADTLANAVLVFLPRRQLVLAGLALSAVVAFAADCPREPGEPVLAQAVRRVREMGIRTVLGAERGRLIRQLLAENLLLALAGGRRGWRSGRQDRGSCGRSGQFF